MGAVLAAPTAHQVSVTCRHLLFTSQLHIPLIIINSSSQHYADLQFYAASPLDAVKGMFVGLCLMV